MVKHGALTTCTKYVFSSSSNKMYCEQSNQYLAFLNVSLNTHTQNKQMNV